MPTLLFKRTASAHIPSIEIPLQSREGRYYTKLERLIHDFQKIENWNFHIRKHIAELQVSKAFFSCNAGEIRSYNSDAGVENY